MSSVRNSRGFVVLARWSVWQPGATLWALATGAATTLALVTLARRHQALEREIAELDHAIARLCSEVNPALVAAPGVGPEVASALVVAAGDNPERLRSEASFAALAGVSPIAASSGKVVRHRLNRGGNREANNALWRIAMVRLAHRHGPTMRYLERRRQEGKSDREIMRCLKRSIAREIFGLLTNPAPVITGTELRELRHSLGRRAPSGCSCPVNDRGAPIAARGRPHASRRVGHPVSPVARRAERARHLTDIGASCPSASGCPLLDSRGQPTLEGGSLSFRCSRVS
ncbi:transposase [Acidimicrobium ferrooxidans]|uniref:transposase n=1 Tax=Acidimicrobium ferrooxidans TaxID=53635 RepID=UPI0009FFA327